MWTRRRRPSAGMRVWGKGSKLICNGGRSLNCGSPARNRATWRRRHPHIPESQIRVMCGADREVGHRVVGGAIIGAGWVIGPAYEVAVGPETRARTELGEDTTVGPGQQLFGWVNWRGIGHEHIVGRLGPDDLLYHQAL